MTPASEVREQSTHGTLRDPYCRGVGSHAALRPDPTAVAATHGVPGPAG